MLQAELGRILTVIEPLATDTPPSLDQLLTVAGALVDHFARERGGRRKVKALQLFVYESDVERCVVNDPLRASREFYELVGNIRKSRLVAQHLPRQPVDVGRTAVYIALGVDVEMHGAAGGTPIDDFDRRDFDDAVAKIGLEAGGFSVQDKLTHAPLPSIALDSRLDLFDGSFDFVVSNPPYVALSEEDKVQDVVKKFEPRVAVFAGAHGLDVIRRLIPQSREALRPRGWLLMEVGYSMSEAVMQLLEGWDEVHSVPDLQGIPRVIVGRKPGF